MEYRTNIRGLTCNVGGEKSPALDSEVAHKATGYANASTRYLERSDRAKAGGYRRGSSTEGWRPSTHAGAEGDHRTAAVLHERAAASNTGAVAKEHETMAGYHYKMAGKHNALAKS